MGGSVNGGRSEGLIPEDDDEPPPLVHAMSWLWSGYRFLIEERIRFASLLSQKNYA